MIKLKAFALAAFAAIVATPATAATGIECVDSGYSAEEDTQFQSFYDGFQLSTWSQQGAPQELLAVISGRAGTCADEHGWSPEAIEQSVYYRLGGMLLHALELRAPLTPTQMNRLRSVVQTADQARLRRVMGGILDSTMAGTAKPEPTQADNIYFGNMLLRTGMPTNRENAEFAGAWIGAKLMKDTSAERFAAR